MRYQDFLARIITESMSAVIRDYSKPSEKNKLQGSLAGLNACRDLQPEALAFLLHRARRVQGKAFHATCVDRYWRVACFTSEVEWVCNVMSAALHNMNMPIIVDPTTRGLMMAARILNEAAN